jgi:hypothetical protein
MSSPNPSQQQGWHSCCWTTRKASQFIKQACRYSRSVRPSLRRKLGCLAIRLYLGQASLSNLCRAGKTTFRSCFPRNAANYVRTYTLPSNSSWWWELKWLIWKIANWNSPWSNNLGSTRPVKYAREDTDIEALNYIIGIRRVNHLWSIRRRSVRSDHRSKFLSLQCTSCSCSIPLLRFGQPGGCLQTLADARAEDAPSRDSTDICPVARSCPVDMFHRGNFVVWPAEPRRWMGRWGGQIHTIHERCCQYQLIQ